MRTLLLLPFKIIALPFMLVLTVLTAFLYFIHAIGETLLMYVAIVLALLGAVALVRSGGNPYHIKTGIAGLVFGFLLSPVGLPALAEFLIGLLDNLNYSLRSFITG